MVVDYLTDFYYFEEPDRLRKTITWLVSKPRFEPCTSRIRRSRATKCSTTFGTKLGNNMEVMPTKHSTTSTEQQPMVRNPQMCWSWGPIGVSGFETGILEKESIKLQSQSVHYLLSNEGTHSCHIAFKCVMENLEYLWDTWKSIAGLEGARLSFYKGSIKKKMSLEHWWNDTDRGKLKYWERNII